MKPKYYGVRLGAEGPKVYNNWAECSHNVTGFPNAEFKGFPAFGQARAWVDSSPSTSSSPDISSALGDIATDPGSDRSDHEELVPTSISLLGNSPENVVCSEAQTEVLPVTGNPVEEVVLSVGQTEVIEKVIQRENVFFTGSAGTGKSVLLRKIIEILGGSISSDLAITASTGIAAVNIGGTTLHSFAGIGLGKESVNILVKKISKNPSALSRWRSCRTLIIDERNIAFSTSLNDRRGLFDKLEELARTLRKRNEPFGGIQLVLSGDFCQLPPVPDRHDGVLLPVTFAFDAQSWRRCIGKPIILTRVFRQKDQHFVDMLNAMRFGRLEPESVVKFKRLKRSLNYSDGIVPTELFPLRQDVENANRNYLIRLEGQAHTYVACDVPGWDIRGKRHTQEKAEDLLERLVAAKEVTLKVGAQVMLIKNLVQGRLVNGSLGKVIDFKTCGDAVASHTQIAQTDDRLSKDGDSKVAPHLLASRRKWPVVRFTNESECLCVPAQFSIVNVTGQDEAKREQIPLILAWALSIHKSQGQTLERVKVNLGRIFEKGQAYVALSRATSMETLEVLDFDERKVMAHPRVLQWQRETVCQSRQEEVLDDMDIEMDNEEAIRAYHSSFSEA